MHQLEGGARVEAMHQALRAAGLASQLILENGGETYRAEETVERMCQGFGLRRADVLALPTGVFITLTDGEGNQASAVVRVRSRCIQLERIDAVNAISRRAARGNLAPAQAICELEALLSACQTRAGMLVAACALSSGFFCLMFGGTALDFAIAALAGALVQLMKAPFARLRVPDVLAALFFGMLVTFIALAGLAAARAGHAEPIISGALMPLLPGLAMTNAIRDTMRGDLVSGVARAAEALLVAIALAAGAGILLALMGGL